VRFAKSSEIEGENVEPSACQLVCLWLPAFFGEASAVRKDHATITRTIQIAINNGAVFGRCFSEVVNECEQALS
jgi:hypothetical protein